MSMEKHLENLGWDKDLIASFMRIKRDFPSLYFDKLQLKPSCLEPRKQIDSTTIKGILEVPVGTNTLFVK